MGRKFSRKQKQSGGQREYDKEGFKAWYQHCFEEFPLKKVEDKGKGKKRKQKTLIGITNYIHDLGTPPAPPARFKVAEDWVAPVEGEEYSQYEADFIEKKAAEGRQVDFEWVDEWDARANNGKGGMVRNRKQTSFQWPKQQYGICIDVPNWLVDYSKHPNAPEGAKEDWRPMRISLNGVNRGKMTNNIFFETDYKTGEIGDKQLLRKIAIAAELDDELKESEWDIGVLAQAACNFQVTCDLTIQNEGKEDEKVFFNKAISKPSKVEDSEDEDGNVIASAERKVAKALENEYLAPFTGMLLDLDPEDYTDELLSSIHSTGNAYKFIEVMEMSEEFVITYTDKEGEEQELDPRGIDYEGSPFEKAYTKYLKKLKAEYEANKDEEDKEEKSSKKSEAKKSTKPEEKEEEKEEEQTSGEDEPFGDESEEDEGDLDLPF
ncbi:hypothetical protein [Vibrio phage RYC]|nr:hypothetical protein [Vibrio phage RYC]